MAQNDLSIEGIDLGYWKHPRTGEERWYVNNYEELVGLELHHYNTGNICSAYLNGEKISNYRAKQLLRSFGKIWLTADGEIHTQYEGEMTATVVEAIKTAQAAQAAAEPAPEPAEEAPAPRTSTIRTDGHKGRCDSCGKIRWVHPAHDMSGIPCTACVMCDDGTLSIA